MRKFILDFVRRGLSACGLGPLVLAVIYLVLYRQGHAETVTLPQVSLGIFSLSILAFVAGGMNVLYQIERLPLMAAISIHGGVLYLTYLATFLVNYWLERGVMPILVFSGIFAVGYMVIWAVIYSVIRRRTAKLNAALHQKRRSAENP